MKVIVIGAGEVGKTLVNMLSGEKHEVSLIESSEDSAKEVADATDALVIKGDATQMPILKDAGIESADAIIAVTTDDKTNLMVCEIAKSLSIKKIIARVNKAENEELFTKLEVTSTVPVVGLTVTAIRKLLESEGRRIIAQLGDGNVQVIEATLSDKSKLIGKPAMIKEAVIGTIYRNGELIIPDEKTKLKKGDVLIITVKTEDLGKITKLMTGDQD